MMGPSLMTIKRKQSFYSRSDPNGGDLEKSLYWLNNVDAPILENFTFSSEDIKKALSELDPNSAAPDGDIPVKLLVACKHELSNPLYLLWKRSLRNETVPMSLKLQYISPIFKKGDKTNAANYHPVSLTFESVVRNHLVDHLESNNLIPGNQHRFRKNRSCLTQLLEHYDHIMRELNSGNEIDVLKSIR